MNVITDLWRYAELCSHDNDEYLIRRVLLSMEQPVTPMVTFMRNNTDFGYICEGGNRVVIAFRGTDGFEAWLRNFDPWPLECENQNARGYIHDGFWDAFENFKVEIDRYFRGSFRLNGDFSRCPVPVFITGHSRGGALATLCARHLAKNRKLPVSCVSFGAPAQGTKKYRDEVDLLPVNHSRVVNGYDIVTTLPPSWLGFRHCGKLFHMAVPLWRKLFRVTKILDHAYSSYTKGLLKYCEARGDLDGADEMKTVLARVTI